jgi:two-component sensor histidine kinase
MEVTPRKSSVPNLSGTAATKRGDNPNSITAVADASTTTEMNHLRWENFELRSLLARCHAELIETRLEAGRDKATQPFDAEGTIRSLGSQLAAAAEALAQVNTSFQKAARQAEELTRTLSERDELVRRKDLINREIDHRVKNSLQGIISLLRIQASREKAPEVLSFAKRACARLEALGTAHDLLHVTNSPDGLDFGAYLERLCACLSHSLEVDGQHRALILEADAVFLPCKVAQALALAVNELVTNAFLHAFRPGEPGTVWVQLSCRKGRMVLTIADDGPGLPEGFTLKGGSGLGLHLVAMMAEQTHARIAVATKGGARFTLSVPMRPEPLGTGEHAN